MKLAGIYETKQFIDIFCTEKQKTRKTTNIHNKLYFDGDLQLNNLDVYIKELENYCQIISEPRIKKIKSTKKRSTKKSKIRSLKKNKKYKNKINNVKRKVYRSINNRHI